MHVVCFSPFFPKIVGVKTRSLFNVESPHKVDDLYYLCLFSDLTVRSLRDLRGEHVPMLKRIQKVVINGLAEKHGVASSQLLAYVALIYRTQLSTFGKSRIASLKKGIRQPPVGT